MDAQFNLQGKKIWVPGCHGMVGSAIIRHLNQQGIEVLASTRQDVNLLDSTQTNQFYAKHTPDIVIMAAAKVGGIHANNSYPADFIAENLQIQQNIISGAYQYSVEKLLFLGSSCIYPKDCPQPIKEEYLLTGLLEPTNESYAIAKIAGIKLCQAYQRQYGCNFICAMPTNLYGANDNFHPENSHVPAALLQRFHHATRNDDATISVWGSGRPYREFMHVDDLADACIFLLRHYTDSTPINIGTGQDISIADFAHLLKDIVGFKGQVEFDSTRPDGVLRKRLDVSKLNALGWHSKISLTEGLQDYYQWYVKNYAEN